MPRPLPVFYLFVPDIRSRFNVGAIFRTADALGVTKIFLTGYTPRPPHPKIDKVALGATNSVPWEYCPQTKKIIKKLKKQKIQIVALEKTKHSLDFTKFKPRWPLALILGNEKTGLKPAVLKEADKIIHLPMLGKKESLNVAVAFAAAAYFIRYH